MEELQKQVRRAYRRLGTRRFFGILGWSWFATLLVALAVIAVDKFYPLGWSPLNWGDWGWLGGMAVVGLAAAMLWLLLTRPGPLGAAIEIDQRFGLKERVSSTLAMPEEELQTEAGQALMKDAVRRVERVDVASRFSIVPPRRMLLPLVPAVLAVLVALLVGQAVVEKPAEAKGEDPAVKKRIKKTTEAVRRKMAERREQAKKLGLTEAEDLFKKLEQGEKDDFVQPKNKKEALSKLTDLAQQLKNRRDKIGGDKLKKQLEQLQKNLEGGPADKLSKSLSKGDFKQAAQELQKLKDQINNSELNEEQKEKLADQLDQMKQKVDQLAENRKKAQQDLQQRMDQMRQAGQNAEANKLEQQLQKMMQQGNQMKQVQDLADKMGQCAQCMRDGKMGDAANAIDQMQAGLNDLQKQLDEMDMLDDAMQQIAQAKDQMNCQACGGAGCDQCQGEPQVGMGRGRGKGERPEADSDTASYDTTAPQKPGKGPADIVGLVEGQNTRGKVQAEIQEQFEETRKGSTDPLTSRRIPRKRREHAREYFDRLREGE